MGQSQPPMGLCWIGLDRTRMFCYTVIIKSKTGGNYGGFIRNIRLEKSLRHKKLF